MGRIERFLLCHSKTYQRYWFRREFNARMVPKLNALNAAADSWLKSLEQK